MRRFEKAVPKTALHDTIKRLEWRRELLWREIARLRSGLPGQAERARTRVDQLKAELEKDFKQTRQILEQREHLPETANDLNWMTWGLVTLFLFLSMISNAEAAGIISSVFDLGGEVIALPFRVVSETFRIVF